jgi:hypothetical protein
MKQTMKQTMKLLGGLALLGLTSNSAKAFTYAFQDSGIISFSTSNVTANTEFAIGYFSGSIITTGSQISLANFVNLNTDGSGGTTWSMPLDIGNTDGSQFISIGTDPMGANTGGRLPLANTPLYFVARSVGDAPFAPFSFALGNSNWLVKTNGPTDPGAAQYSWGEGFAFANATVLTPNVSLAADGSGLYTLTVADLTAIPEPSVASLLALGTVGLVALRVRRKS